jgi:ATP-dependent DNA helicase RecQ
MRDQVEQLNKRGIKAISINATLSKKEIDIALDNCIYGDVKFLYLSPERLQNDLFLARIAKMNVSLIAVDEAHCISQWGYDFRPPYLKISEIRNLLPHTPVIALTATATPKVVVDIQEKLAFKNGQVFQKSFERPNLGYHIRYSENKLNELLTIIKKINGSIVIYTRNRKQTKTIAEWLNYRNIGATYYHAGLTNEQRTKAQNDWIKNKVKIIVATNAFGMGIDKPDVRLVIHVGVPDSLEAYFQEAGRAGRDEKKAFALLMYNQNDIDELNQLVNRVFPPVEEIKRIYQALANYYQLAIGSGQYQSFAFDIEAFSKNYQLQPLVVYNSLKLLERQGHLTLSDAFYQPSRLMFRVDSRAVYNYQIQHPKYGKIIQTLLRSYGGLFENFVKINENDIAKHCGLSSEQVVKALKNLAQEKVIFYEPQTDLPFITFNEGRLDVRDLRLSAEIYQNRKKEYQERINKIIHFITSKDVCRTKLLLDYFGEVYKKECLICDVCRNNYKNKQLKEVENRLYSILNHKGQTSLSELKLLLKDTTEDQLNLIIRSGVEQGTILVHGDVIYIKSSGL